VGIVRGAWHWRLVRYSLCSYFSAVVLSKLDTVESGLFWFIFSEHGACLRSDECKTAHPTRIVLVNINFFGFCTCLVCGLRFRYLCTRVWSRFDWRKLQVTNDQEKNELSVGDAWKNHAVSNQWPTFFRVHPRLQLRFIAGQGRILSMAKGKKNVERQINQKTQIDLVRYLGDGLAKE